MTTTNPPGRHLAVVDTPPAAPPAADVDIDSIVQSLTTLVDLGRAITARASGSLLKVEHLICVALNNPFHRLVRGSDPDI